MTTKEKEIFTTEEAAEMMGCSPSTIEEHARNRVLPGLRMGHEWRFPREAFMRSPVSSTSRRNIFASGSGARARNLPGSLTPSSACNSAAAPHGLPHNAIK